MPSIEVPDLYFTVLVDYGSVITEPEDPTTYDCSVLLAGVVLYTRRYTDDRTILNEWRKNKALHAEGKAYDPGKRPHNFVHDYDDAKQTVMVEFAEHLKEVLNRPDPMARY